MNLAVIIKAAYDAAAKRPFVWGSDDCVTWASGIAEQITGKDPIAEFRGSYDSEAGVKRLMLKHGWKDMGDIAGHFYREIPKATARTGDWVLVPNPDGPDSICVVSGTLVAGKTISGMATVSISRATRAFRVE